ncbi:MAG: mandelate racemase/muconate lactonizing enzyme family protein, partial [Xanthobacteraceae bacterium]|nr:mandelate racemase/muconate lactonizing enzyme family protein [Xanthobacteraceae bacterium]
IAALMDDLARKLHNCGRNGPLSFALSGLDIALWDIPGKPLYQLLGGGSPHPRSRLCEPVALWQRRSRRAQCGMRHGTRLCAHEITVSEVAAARNAIGADMPLMVDTNCPWSADEAIAMARAFAPYNLHWLEEPMWPPDDYAALARVRSAGVPIAVGENAGTPIDIEQLIDVAKVNFVQPGETKIGGMSEMQRLTALAAARGTKLAPHSPYFGPGLIATIHICAGFYCDLEASPFGDQVNATAGSMTVPQGPGAWA